MTGPTTHLRNDLGFRSHILVCNLDHIQLRVWSIIEYQTCSKCAVSVAIHNIPLSISATVMFSFNVGFVSFDEIVISINARVQDRDFHRLGWGCRTVDFEELLIDFFVFCFPRSIVSSCDQFELVSINAESNYHKLVSF